MRRLGQPRQVFFLGLLLAGGLFLAGCGGSSSTAYKYRIAVIPKGLTHEFWQSIERGAKRAGADLTEKGIATQIIWDGPLKENDMLEQISIIDRNIEDQKKAGKPTITWLSKDKFAGATKDTARREAEPLLNNMRDKGIDGMFAPNESSASGTVDALRCLGLNKQLRLVGFDSSAPLLQ